MTENNRNNHQLEHIIGVAGDAGFCVLDKEIAYAAAQRVIIHDVDRHSQRFINKDVGCIATNHSSSLLAVAPKGSGKVELYDTASLRLKTKLVHLAPTSDVYHISFAKDSSVILTLAKSPECAMTLWTMSKKTADVAATMKLSSAFDGEVLQADVCPANSSVLSVLGKNEIQMFRPSTKMNSRFIPLPLSAEANTHECTTQCWLQSGDLIVGTASERVIVFGENREVKQVVGTKASGARCIVGCPNGFAVGCNDGSFVLFRQASKDDEAFTMANSIDFPGKDPIISLGLIKLAREGDSNTLSVMCLTETNEVIRFPLLECDDLTTIVPSLNTKRSDMKHLIPQFGSLFVDSCSWLPLIAIGGYDGNCRILNHQNKQVQVSHNFGDPITGVSLHPNGKYVLLSTSKQVCLCSIHETRMSVLWHADLPNASIVKFSPGGDKFGIATATILQVHNFHSNEYSNIATLRGHSKPIVRFEFAPYKDELCTVGVDSVVCLWDCRKGVVIKRTNLLCPASLSACIDWNERAAYVMTADCFLKKVSLDEGTIDIEAKCDIDDKLLTTLPSGKLLVSSNDGIVGTLCFEDSSLVSKRLSNCGLVTSAAYNSNGQGLLIAGGGCLTMASICEEASAVRPNYCPFNDIIITSREEFASVDDKIKAIEDKLGSTKEDHVSRLNALESEADCTMKQLNIVHQDIVKDIQAESSRIREEIDLLKERIDLKLNELKAQHDDNMSSVIGESEKKISKEKDNTATFEGRCDELRQVFDAEMAKMKELHDHQIELEQGQFNQQMEMVQQMEKETKSCIDSIRLQVSEKERLMDEDAEREIAELWLAHHKKLKNLRRSKQLLLNEKSLLQRQYNAMLYDLTELQEQISSQEELHRETVAAITTLDDNIKLYTDEIIEKDQYIVKTEHDMSMLSQANLEDEQQNADIIKERKGTEDEMKPFMEEVQAKKSEAIELTKQIKADSNTLSHLNVDLDCAKTKLKQAKQQLASLTNTCLEKKSLIASLDSKLFSGTGSALSCMNDHQLLKTCLRSLFDEYLDDKQRRQTKSQTEMLLSLEKKVDTMKKTMERKRSTHAKDMKRLKREHGVLVKELGESKILANTSNVMITDNAKEKI